MGCHKKQIHGEQKLKTEYTYSKEIESYSSTPLFDSEGTISCLRQLLYSLTSYLMKYCFIIYFFNDMGVSVFFNFPYSYFNRCNCSLPNMSDNNCCPECNPRHSCRHQELRHVIFNHGDHWSFQCHTCECYKGEIDCMPMICPPLFCDNPVKNPEDCCGHCEGDPCSLTTGNSSATGQSCTYRGRTIQSGSQFIDPNDRCTTCNCKVGDV